MAAELMILTKCRAALVGLITASNVGTANIYDAKRSGDKSADAVECDAVNAQEEPMGSGNFWVDLEVKVKTIGAVDSDGVDPKGGSDVLTANVFAALEVSNLAALLNIQVSNFTVMGFGSEKGVESGIEGDCWVETWRRRAYCCGASF